MQLGLDILQEGGDGETQKRRKTLISCPVRDLSHSHFNPRLDRDSDDVKKLADRIKRNGYEITRAVWVYEVDGKKEVFAGGTRLEAVKTLGLEEIPAILHEGFSEDEIVRLSTEDNENDEYHTPLNCVEVWSSYKKLRDIGWTQERIAKAKGVTRSLVSYRLQCSDFPESIHEYFVNKEFLNERQALELLKLSTVDNLSSWLDRETTMQEIMESVLKLSTTKITAKIFAKEVEKYNGYMAKAGGMYDGLADDAKERFVQYLGGARSINQIERAYTRLVADLQKEEEEKLRRHRDQEAKMREEEQRLAEERRKQQAKDALLSKLVLGDFKQRMEELEDNSVDLIFTDPPYSNEDLHVYGQLAEIAATKLKEGGSLLAYTGHYALDAVIEAMKRHLRYWWLISLVHSGNSKKLEGKRVAVGWKPILWFVRGTFKGDSYIKDTFISSQPDKELHDHQQDTSEAEYYIDALTAEGDLVVDPFLGSGTTLVAAYRLNRDFWGCEIQEDIISTAKDRLLAEHEELSRANDQT